MLIFHQRGEGCFAYTKSETSFRVTRLAKELASYTKGLKDDQWVAGDKFTRIGFYEVRDIDRLIAIPKEGTREVLVFVSDGMANDEELRHLSGIVNMNMEMGFRTGLFGLPALVDGASVLEHITDEGKLRLW